MIRIQNTRIAAATLITLVALGLTACATGDSAGESGSAKSANAEASETTTEEVAEEPADLVGEWVQSNSASTDSFQTATITADSIEVLWVNAADDTTALYWAGTYAAPAAAGAFQWDSQNDTEKTAGAMLASGDPTKTFSYDNETISYDVTAMGVTKTVELKRK